MLTAVSTLAALSWDPQIRGASIVILSVLILCGSVYLLLATNTGAKLGLLLALTGLAGWMFLMGVVWVVFGIGLKGRDPEWVPKEVISGPASESTLDFVDEDFPRGWDRFSAAEASDAQAAADIVLTGSSGEAGGHGGGGGEAHEPEFEPVFGGTGDYVQVGAFRRGGENSFLPGGALEHPRGIFHAPHYAVIQVQPALKQVSLDGAPVAPRPDPRAEVTTVVMVRDLGNKRFPSTILTIAMGILFGVLCNVLHKRDKEIMAMRAAGAAA